MTRWGGLLLVLAVTSARSAYVLRGSEEKDLCSGQEMNCSFSSSNCLDPAWIISHLYTPSGPDHLDLKISTRPDQTGNLVPVLNVTWTLRDDGSISFLKASQLHLLVVSTNQNLCVRYTFNKQLSMRSPSGDQWTLRSDVLVVDPGKIYRVSVENIPKPEMDHSSSSLSREVSVPGCSDPLMKRTKPCIQSGSLWRSDMVLSRSEDLVLTVDFSPDSGSDQYLVLSSCGSSTERDLVQVQDSTNRSRLRTNFSLELWVRGCCRFTVQIKPFFSGCGNDCVRHRRDLDVCGRPRNEPSAAPSWRPLPLALGLSVFVLLAVAVGVCSAIICSKRGGKASRRRRGPTGGALLEEHRLKENPTLLLVYSKDHPLFQEVVLSLSAFLQAQCGVQVLLDLLDESLVSQVGLMRWLELQRNQLRPKDKILVLCSRGVQSKWRSMCGQGHVTHQPDDLIGPFLSLFLSDLHQPRSMGRYIAAYFEDISSLQDVPSFFDIAVKYKLMKHFEELYFRVLDMEKYEPQKVNRIQGIGPEEYFRCPSGRRLRNAVETFQAFQTQNPDWFVKGGAKDLDEAGLLMDQLHVHISQRVPVVRNASDIFTNDVITNEDVDLFYVVAPESRRNLWICENEALVKPPPASEGGSVLELQPDPRPGPEILVSSVLSAGAGAGQSVEGVAGLSLLRPEEVEEVEEVEEAGGSEWEPVMEEQIEAEVEEFPRSKADTSGSDQGYGSKVWTEPDSEDLRALLQLQHELMSHICHSGAQ